MLMVMNTTQATKWHNADGSFNNAAKAQIAKMREDSEARMRATLEATLLAGPVTPVGKARVTTANARWARAAEARDERERHLRRTYADAK